MTKTRVQQPHIILRFTFTHLVVGNGRTGQPYLLAPDTRDLFEDRWRIIYIQKDEKYAYNLKRNLRPRQCLLRAFVDVTFVWRICHCCRCS